MSNYFNLIICKTGSFFMDFVYNITSCNCDGPRDWLCYKLLDYPLCFYGIVAIIMMYLTRYRMLCKVLHVLVIPFAASLILKACWLSFMLKMNPFDLIKRIFARHIYALNSTIFILYFITVLCIIFGFLLSEPCLSFSISYKIYDKITPKSSFIHKLAPLPSCRVNNKTSFLSHLAEVFFGLKLLYLSGLLIQLSICFLIF